MDGDVVVGIYLERNGGALMQADASDENGQKRITPTSFQEFSWDPLQAPEAASGIEQMAEVAARIGPRLKSVAIASYGPFTSHDRDREPAPFTILSPAAHMPLRAVRSHELFSKTLLKLNKNIKTPIKMHSDAEACAIGESIIRSVDTNFILAYLLVTEGIGLGIVQGRRPLSYASRSEIGMLHVRYQRSDPLRPPKEYSKYAKSLSNLSDNNSVRTRYAMCNNLGHVEDIDIMNSSDELWDMRAYYLAQACFSCAVMLSPHKIVIGCDLDVRNRNNSDNVASMTTNHFQNLMNSRYIDGYPAFYISEFSNSDYIDTPRSFSNELNATFRTTGSLGMCYAAAVQIIESVEG